MPAYLLETDYEQFIIIKDDNYTVHSMPSFFETLNDQVGSNFTIKGHFAMFSAAHLI